MIKILSVTARNFLSIGNVTQSVNLDRQDLTLILGENLDLGGDDAGARNGTGKSALLNIASFALYGQALTNIKKDNLINRTNDRNMLVTVEFQCRDQLYRIERGRRPNILKFYIGGHEQQSQDESQGDSRETQQAIQRIIHMSPSVFQHIVALNTYTQPFLSLRSQEQREIIEELLGITVLSEKAELLKEKIKITKDLVIQAEAEIRARIDSNKHMMEQIQALQRRQQIWQTQQQKDLHQLNTALANLTTVDIDQEIQAHRDLVQYNQLQQAHRLLDTDIRRGQIELQKQQRASAKLESEIAALLDHRCPACGQAVHDHGHQQLLSQRATDMAELESEISMLIQQLDDATLKKSLLADPGPQPRVFYDHESQAIEHRASVSNIQQQIIRKNQESDPYQEQITDMQNSAVLDINYQQLNTLAAQRDHQEFLLKLLTNKDSFIRKKIIDQNLNYLNSRLSWYLERTGLPHQVRFLSDLNVEITELGRDLNFDNLSRGERNRLILSLSWAFRDVWENLYDKMNIMFVDELLDSGLDSMGMENSLAILKKISRDTHKSVWLVSHRDELVSRVNNILRVTKQNGFTTYSTDIEI